MLTRKRRLRSGSLGATGSEAYSTRNLRRPSPSVSTATRRVAHDFAMLFASEANMRPITKSSPYLAAAMCLLLVHLVHLLRITTVTAVRMHNLS